MSGCKIWHSWKKVFLCPNYDLELYIGMIDKNSEWMNKDIFLTMYTIENHGFIYEWKKKKNLK